MNCLIPCWGLTCAIPSLDNKNSDINCGFSLASKYQVLWGVRLLVCMYICMYMKINSEKIKWLINMLPLLEKWHGNNTVKQIQINISFPHLMDITILGFKYLRIPK